MKRIFRWLFLSVLGAVLLSFGVLLLLQSKWTKSQLSEVLQEMALQTGIKLSIGQIEGELPLKWTFTDVHLVFPDDETLDIDRLQLRLAILPLLRGYLGLSYLHADRAFFAYTPHESNTPSSKTKIKGSYFLHFASIDQMTILNRKTEHQAVYQVTGKGKWAGGGKSFLADLAVRSEALDAKIFIEGSQKRNYLQTDIELKALSSDAFAPFYSNPYLIPLAKNKDIFQLRESCPGFNDRKLGSINPIQPNLRSLNPGALTRSNMSLFFTNGITSFEFKAHCEGPWKTWKNLLAPQKALASSKPISGTVEFQTAEMKLSMIDSPINLHLFSHFSLFGDRSLDLSHLSIQSPLAKLEGSAQIDARGNPQLLHSKLLIPDLSYLTSHIKGSASGELSLKKGICELSLTLPQFAIDETIFTNSSFELSAHQSPSGWDGSLQMKADNPLLGYQASAAVHWIPSQSIEMKEFDLTSLNGRLSGDFIYSLQDLKSINGGFSFQIKDLSSLSQITSIPLAGQLGGEVQFEGEEISCLAIGKHLKIDQFIADGVHFDLSHVKFSQVPQDNLQGNLKITSGPSYFYDIYFSSFTYEMGWNTIDWNYRFQAEGDWKGPFNIGSHGTLALSPHQFQLTCEELQGKMLEKQIQLTEPVQLLISKELFQIDKLNLSLDDGSFYLSSALSPTHANLKVNANHFPLDFLTIFSKRFSLKGLSSINIDLEGSAHQLKGHLGILLEHAAIYPAGSSSPIETKGNIQAHLSGNSLQLHAHVVATGEQFCEISATAPFAFDLSPLQFHLIQNEPIAGQCTIEGHTEQLFDFINMGSQRVGGFLSCHFLLSGSLNEPLLYGPCSVQGGFYENYFIGIAVKDTDITAEAKGRTLVVEKAFATDGEKGTSESTGVFHLTSGLPFSVQGTIQHFRVIRFDWLTGACSGPFTINGNLEKALAKGNLELDEADVTIPDQLPSDIPSLPVTFVNQPKSHLEKLTYSEPYPFHYDIDVHGDHDLRLSGRGIDAELEGKIHMTGKNLSVVASGALYTKKGKFSFAGKDFNITKGELLFSDSSGFLNISSSAQFSDLIVTVHFRGSLTSPQLIFESNPSMPTSAILARILFNKDVSELSASQAIQLANTIVTLSGGSAPNVLETIRKNLGIDRLSFTTSEETGQVSVQIGKYLAQGVMITLTQSTETSHVKVEVELKAGFVLEAETQANNQGKFSFKWNKNY